MSKRLAGVLLLVLLSLGLPALPAAAVEGGGEAVEEPLVEEGPPPGINEIGTQNDVSRKFFPEPYAEPTVFDPLKFGLLIPAVLITAVLLLLFLLWQPRFAQERRRKAAKKGKR